MGLDYNGVLMRVYLSESHRSRGEPLHRRIVEFMLECGLAGAIAFHGAEGFGSQRRVSSDAFVDARGDLPVAIEVVDEESRIRAFLPELERLLEDGFVTLERISLAR